VTAADPDAEVPEPLRLARAGARCELDLMDGKIEEAVEQFTLLAKTASDPALNELLNSCVTAARRAGQNAAADRLCRAALDGGSERPVTVGRAAALWVENVQPQADPTQAVSRLEQLLDFGVRPEVAARVHRQQFYTLAGKESADLYRRLFDLSSRLVQTVPAGPERDGVQALAFDAAFLAERYDECLRLLDASLPGRDEQWTAVARNKVLAHKALAEGNTEDAVARFRAFMKDLEGSWKEPERDPTTGLTYSKEMTLGFNAARIGTILKKAGRNAEALAAFAEAREYYQNALKELEDGSREARHVQAELAKLPVTEGGS
jgi:tetratricopeptide (TPR) repeat protein